MDSSSGRWRCPDRAGHRDDHTTPDQYHLPRVEVLLGDGAVGGGATWWSATDSDDSPSVRGAALGPRGTAGSHRHRERLRSTHLLRLILEGKKKKKTLGRLPLFEEWRLLRRQTQHRLRSAVAPAKQNALTKKGPPPSDVVGSPLRTASGVRGSCYPDHPAACTCHHPWPMPEPGDSRCCYSWYHRD